MRLSPLVALTFLAVACAPKAETPAASMELSAAALDSAKGVDIAFAAAMNSKDTAAVVGLYADDASFLPPDSPILEKAAIHPVLAGFIAAGAADFVMNTTKAYGIGDMAYLVGTVTYTMGGAPQSDKYAEVVRRGADGKWRYVVDMFSALAPPATAPAK